jgi:transcriptional regulator with XRE-family HTH domain
MNEYGRFIRSVKEAMRRRELSEGALARRVGISQSYLSLILAGKRSPPADDIIEDLARILDLNRDRLLLDAGRLPTYLRWVPPLMDNGYHALRQACTRITQRYAAVDKMQAQRFRRSDRKREGVGSVKKSGRGLTPLNKRG